MTRARSPGTRTTSSPPRARELGAMAAAVPAVEEVEDRPQAGDRRRAAAPESSRGPGARLGAEAVEEGPEVGASRQEGSGPAARRGGLDVEEREGHGRQHLTLWSRANTPDHLGLSRGCD
jgi:hypothetical protein